MEVGLLDELGLDLISIRISQYVRWIIYVIDNVWQYVNQAYIDVDDNMRVQVTHL